MRDTSLAKHVRTKLFVLFKNLDIFQNKVLRLGEVVIARTHVAQKRDTSLAKSKLSKLIKNALRARVIRK